MRLLVSLVIFSATLSSCGGKAPPIDLCMVRVDKDIPIIHNEDGSVTIPKDAFSTECIFKDGSTGEKKIEELDKWVAAPFEQLADYFQYCKIKR